MNTTIQTLFSLEGTVAVVTGAGSGIGRGCSEALAEAGAAVICADINEQAATETKERIEESTTQTAYVQHVDVSSEDDVHRVFTAVARDFGRLDILFNCAGICHRDWMLHEFPRQEWDQIIAVNLTSVFLCCREALPLMMRNGSGRIVNISSQLAERGSKTGKAAGMCATKGAVAALTRDLAIAYADRGIRVNAIAPGSIKTNIAQRLYPDRSYEEISEMLFKDAIQSIPVGRIGIPADLKGAAVFLASKASEYVNGHILWVDGGQAAHC